jgi:TP901 family phage tail tape measure protein
MGEGVNLGSAYGTIEIGTDGAQQSINSLSDTMRKAGAAMSLGVTAPLVGIASAAISSAADFEQSLNIMAQVSAATGDQMAALQAQALEMGAVTSFSAGEAAQAQLELAKAGMAPADVMKALPGVLDAAAAGGMGLAESATLVSGALNAFGLDASESASVANQLAAAANASAADMSDLGAGLQQGGFAFSAAGQQLDDLNASLAILSNVGLSGSDAGTALKNAMMRLMNPTAEAAGLMEELGINVYDTQGQMLPWADVIQVFDTALAGLTDEQRNAALGTIMLGDGMKAFIPLLDQGKEGFLEMKAAVNQEGSAAATAGARMKGMRGAVEYLMGSIDSFLIGTALPFLDTFSGVVRIVADGITAFGALPRPVIDAALAFAAVLAAAGPLMLAISGIATAAAFLASPLGLLVLGVGAVAAGFVMWQQNLGGIQQRVAALATYFKDLAESVTGLDFDAIADGLRSFANYIGLVVEDGDYLNDWLTNLPPAVQPAAEALGRFVAAVSSLFQTGDFGALAQTLRDAFPEAAAAVDGAISTISEAFGKIAETIQSFREGYLDVPELIWNIANALTGGGADYYVIRDAVNAIGAAWQSIQGAALALWAWLQIAIPLAVTSLQGAWAAAWPAMLEAFGATWDALRTGLAAAWTWLSINIPAALAWLAAAWAIAWPAMQAAWDAVWPAIQSAWGTAQTFLSTDLPAALATMQEKWDTVWPAAQATWSAVWTPLSAAWTTAKTWLDTTLPAALTTLQTAWEGAWPALQTATTTAWTAIQGTFDSIKAAFAAVQTGAGNLRTTLSGFAAQAAIVGGLLAAFFAPALERLQTAFNALPEKLAPLLPKLQELGGAIGGLMQALAPFVALIGVGLAIAVNFGIERLTTTFETLPGLLGPIIDQVTATIKLITVILTEVVAGVRAAIDGDWTAVWGSAKRVASEFSTFFRGLFSRLGTFMRAVARNISEPIINTLKSLGIDITPHLESVRKTFEDIWTKVKGYIQPVIDIVGTVTDKFSEFKEFLAGLELPNPFAGLASAGQAVMDAIGNLGGGGNGGADGDPSTPEAGGTSYFRGGAAQINERGYEQVVLPAGSRVYTNGQTNNLPTGEARTININMGGITVKSDRDAHYVVNTLRDALAGMGA